MSKKFKLFYNTDEYVTMVIYNKYINDQKPYKER